MTPLAGLSGRGKVGNDGRSLGMFLGDCPTLFGSEGGLPR
jgi:hypothetical protein